ncbi:AHH domain-containing protein, partial [Clostridium gasigenes]
INNGNNSGLNLIKDGLKWATGDKAGEAIYTAVNVIDLALNIPHMVKGLVKGGKSIINSGSSIKNFFKKGPMIIGDFKDGASKYIDELVDGIGNVMSPKRGYAGIGQISEKDINNLSKVDIKPITKNDIQNNYNRIVNEGKGIEGVTQAKPNQVHHFATNKSKKYTQQFEQITNKYKLDLDDMWNKELMPHQGRHPYAYHDYMLEQMKKFDKIANGNQDKFLKLYEQVKQKVINNPDMITKDYWNKK